MRSMNHNSAVPIYCNEVPRQRYGHNGGIKKPRQEVSTVTEIKGAEVSKVKNKNKLRPVKVGASKKYYSANVKKVVQNKVATDTGSREKIISIFREKKVGNISKLENK